MSAITRRSRVAPGSRSQKACRQCDAWFQPLRLKRNGNLSPACHREHRGVKGRGPQNAARLITETVLLTRHAEKVVIQPIVEVGVVENTDRIGAGR